VNVNKARLITLLIVALSIGMALAACVHPGGLNQGGPW
jgi:hypothetical protein